jgi:TolA-binding protein
MPLLRNSQLRNLRPALALVLIASFALPANAESKDMIQLQTQMQQLLDAVARLQQANDERMGVLKDLVQQNSDSVNKMSVTLDGLKLQLQNMQDASGTKNEQLAGQIQSLNDSLDEMKARVARIEKSLNDIQSQQQTTNAMLTNLPQPGAPLAVPAAPVGKLPAAAKNAAPVTRTPAPVAPAPVADLPAPVAGPSAGELYRAALGDYMGAKYALSASEFSDLIKAYPDDNLSGNAYFYIGEMDAKAEKLSAAVKSYDQLLERYPDNTKVPAAHLHKAYALIAMKQNDAGVRELRALIQRFPTSAEASQARSKLSSMRVTVAPRD